MIASILLAMIAFLFFVGVCALCVIAERLGRIADTVETEEERRRGLARLVASGALTPSEGRNLQ